MTPSKRTPRSVKVWTDWNTVFKDRVVGSRDGCVVFMGSRSKFGYGSIRFNGETTTTHRVSYLLACGEIPKGMCVLHKCDNPPCVNPRHLEIGDRAKNMMDCVLRGRHNNVKKTVCRNGHPYSKENTRVINKKDSKERICITCHRASNRKWSYLSYVPIQKKRGK